MEISTKNLQKHFLNLLKICVWDGITMGGETIHLSLMNRFLMALRAKPFTPKSIVMHVVNLKNPCLIKNLCGNKFHDF